MQDPSAASTQPAKVQQGPTIGAHHLDTTETPESLYTVPQALATLAEPAVPPAQVHPPRTEMAEQEQGHEAGMAGPSGQRPGSSQKPVASKGKAGKRNPLARALQAISSGCGRCCGRMPGESPRWRCIQDVRISQRAQVVNPIRTLGLHPSGHEHPVWSCTVCSSQRAQVMVARPSLSRGEHPGLHAYAD